MAKVRQEEKRNGRSVGAAETIKERAEWRRLQRNNLNISSWQERQSRLCQKEKEQNRLSKAPDLKEGKSQSEREPHFGEKAEDQSVSMGKKGWTPQ